MKSIEEGLEEAYKKYGENAYFGNGFKAGVEFAKRWIPIEEEKPETKQMVYVVCEYINQNSEIFRFQTIAEYIPYMTVKEEDYMDDDYFFTGDYNEKEDEYYATEGFYEWNSESEIKFLITSKITHWLPLFELPKKL